MIIRCVTPDITKEGDSMRIGFIGAGKAGFSLGRLFKEKGMDLCGYYSRNPESAREAAAFTDSRFYSDLKDLTDECDAIFITVLDGAIESVYRQLCRFEIKGKILCHCSGSITAASAFPDIGETGAKGISIHPLFPISSKTETWRELQDAFFCLEGEEEACESFRRLFAEVGLRTQNIAGADKVRYHAGCVMASNFICGLIQESVDLLTQCGFNEENAISALSPLIRSNLDHILADGPTAALTGPVERGDAVTLRRHLASLTSEEEREMYRSLSAKLTEMAERKHPERDYREIRQLLSEQKTESERGIPT